MQPVTREDAFLEFQMNRLIAELQEFKKLLEPVKTEESVIVETPVVKRGRKKRDTLGNDSSD